MPTITSQPTLNQFTAYCRAFDYFNAELFGGRLPACFLNFSRKAGTGGFFAENQWARNRAKDTEQRSHEISINPDVLVRPVREVMSFLVHEMTHLEQKEFGRSSRAGYHNRQWGELMERVGLMPSHTGAPGGKRVGQRMSHYVIDGGPFEQAFERMPQECKLPWEAFGLSRGGKKSASKSRYTCPYCRMNVWGKPGLGILCGTCRDQSGPVALVPVT